MSVEDILRMPAEWCLNIVVPICKGDCEIRNSCCYRVVTFLEHGMMVVEGVLEKRLCGIVTVSEMQFICLSVKRTIDPVFVLRRLQEEYYADGKRLFCGHRENF